MGEPLPISIPPGVRSQPTRNKMSTNWRAANLVRWNEGKLSPVGGWQKRSYAGNFASKCRAIHRWTVNDGRQHIAYLCEGHVYVDKGDGIIVDISPTAAIVRPFSDLTAGGYGEGLYGADAYGTPRPARTVTDLRITYGYYADNWGQNLLIMTGADGRLLMWDPSTVGAKLTAVTNAPIGNRGFIVMPQRHVILLGAGGHMNRYQWCGLENITDWSVSVVTSLAGFNEVQPASPIIAGCRSGNEAVFFTENGNAFYVDWIGVPYVFAADVFANGCTPRSPMSIVDTPIGAVWSSESGFWKYEGRNAVPIECGVWDFITDSVDKEFARINASMVTITMFTEIWWLYPSEDQTENDRYVIWNYKEGWWSTGFLKRTCGVNSTYTGYPIMSDGLSAYDHEVGQSYGGTDLPWVETFAISVNNGYNLATFDRLLVDFDGQTSSVAYELLYTIPRTSGSQEYSSGNKAILDNGFVPFRCTGRDFRIRVKQIDFDTPPWTIGDQQVELYVRGKQ